MPTCPALCKSPKCPTYQNRTAIDPMVTPIIWVLGGPGSGKGTQCANIVTKYGFTHLSTGDLLRNEVQSGTERGKSLSSVMERGGLVPNDIVLALLKEAMIEHAETAIGFLIDGYPREVSQGMEFEKVIAPVTGILFFEASHDTLRQRLLSRGQTSNRADDNIQTIQLRLKTFSENNDKVIGQYKDKLITINAEAPPEAIFNQVINHLDPIVKQAEANKIAKKSAAMAAAGTPAGSSS